MIKAKTTAVILRKTIDGKILIVGSILDNLDEFLIDENEHLLVGELTLTPKHIFNTYEPAPGLNPNDLLSGGGLSHKNYKTKIL
jgi:hypothetical protein